MCGIAGIYNAQDLLQAQNLLPRFTDAISHRGPDAAGVLTRERTVFGHRRLAIIDLDPAANQPMIDVDDRVMLTFNGEIYNFQTLRRELQARGAVFRTSGDSEVIIQLYLAEGIDGLHKLDGMFAFALYDRRNGEMILMRDRLGKKPLYYFTTPAGEVVFASELSALKLHPAWRGILRNEAVSDFLAYQYIPGEETVFSGVYKLPAAGMMHCFPDGRQEITSYWQLDHSRKLDLTLDEASRILREKLTEAVRKRLIADVPCGIFLSGGVDSNIAAMLAAQLSDSPLQAFTIGFDVERYDERTLARAGVKWINSHTPYGLIHREKVVDFNSFETLQKLAGHFGEPFADFSMLPEYFLSQFAASEAKLVLSGDGADEIFGGYERYLAMKYCAVLDKLLPAAARRALYWTAGKLFTDGGKRSRGGRLLRLLKLCTIPAHRRYIEVMSQSDGQLRRNLYGSRLAAVDLPDSGRFIEALNAGATAVNQLERNAEIDLKSYLYGDILVKVDRSAMANSLEVRSPFLDTDVLEFAASLPWGFKQKGSQRKVILRHCCGDCLAPEISAGRKRGFAVPLGDWFKNQWHDRLQTHLLEGNLVKDDWMERAALQNVINAHHSGRTDHTELLAALLMLELFLEQA